MKINKDALVALLFWFGYYEIIATIVSFGTGTNWWILQPFVIGITLFIVAMTKGSQTRGDI